MALWAQRAIDALPGIWVRDLIIGRQSLEVGARGDSTRIGWYGATNKVAFCECYKPHGRGFVIIVGLLAIILTVLTLPFCRHDAHAQDRPVRLIRFLTICCCCSA